MKSFTRSASVSIPGLSPELVEGSKAGVEGQHVGRWVRLSIYDLLGREVAVLVNEEKHYGVHTVTWNASNMPSGIYFARLTSGGFSKTRKIVLLR